MHKEISVSGLEEISHCIPDLVVFISVSHGDFTLRTASSSYLTD